jgi:hypothetical protein
VQRDILNTWIAEYAHLKGYGLIDFYAVINDPSNPGHSNPALVMSDGLHPNAAGYTAMGNATNLAIFTSSAIRTEPLANTTVIELISSVFDMWLAS